jgi:hypothetical protein
MARKPLSLSGTAKYAALPALDALEPLARIVAPVARGRGVTAW